MPSSSLIKIKETYNHSVESKNACVEIGFSLLNGLAGQSTHNNNNIG